MFALKGDRPRVAEPQLQPTQRGAASCKRFRVQLVTTYDLYAKV